MASSSSKAFVPAGADMDMARGLGPRELRINIVNSSKKMFGVPALCINSGEKYTVSFGFDDVRGTVEVDGEQAHGIFDSDRDNGRYEATFSKTSASGVRCYAGKWFNNKRKSGGFQLELPQVPRPLGLGESKRRRIESITEPLRNLGTKREPVYLVPDNLLFNDQGRKVMQFFVSQMNVQGLALPYVSGDKEWKSWRPYPEGCGDRIRVNRLNKTADHILDTHLRRRFGDVWHIMTPDRGYDAKDINVYYQGGSKGKHQDVQPYGSLVFVFCAGLSCTSSVWLEDGTKVDLTMNSGDCMVFEGKTWHRVNQCIPHTSPFRANEWLGNRRLSILVRQRPPSSSMDVPRRRF